MYISQFHKKSIHIKVQFYTTALICFVHKTPGNPSGFELVSSVSEADATPLRHTTIQGRN
jgi:hypothetical protein